MDALRPRKRRSSAGRALAILLLTVAATPLAAMAAEDAPRTEPDSANPRRLLDAVVHLHAEIPADARTAPTLGTKREGAGILIDDAGLVVTIGYLITEAMAVEIRTGGGVASQAQILGFDAESGLGLVRALDPLGIKPLPLGTALGLEAKTPVLIAGAGGIEAAQPSVILSRRSFAGPWEYLLDQAIFTAPAYRDWGGAALISADGKLVGIGSLLIGDAAGTAEGGKPEGAAPPDAARGGPIAGNMFVPIDRLQPVLGDLIATGRPGTPPHPWLGLSVQPFSGALLVARVSAGGPAEKAGIRRGDRITAVSGDPVDDLAGFYRKVWSIGAAGVSVPLTLTRNGAATDIEVESIDRYRYLKLNTTY